MAKAKKTDIYDKTFGFFGTEKMEQDLTKLMLETLTFNKSEMLRQICAAGIEKMKADLNITDEDQA